MKKNKIIRARKRKVWFRKHKWDIVIWILNIIVWTLVIGMMLDALPLPEATGPQEGLEALGIGKILSNY